MFVVNVIFEATKKNQKFHKIGAHWKGIKIITKVFLFWIIIFILFECLWSWMWTFFSRNITISVVCASLVLRNRQVVLQQENQQQRKITVQKKKTFASQKWQSADHSNRWKIFVSPFAVGQCQKSVNPFQIQCLLVKK
jgi:hypothetical protein